MARRRRLKSGPEEAIVGVIGLVVLGCVFSPQFRTIAIIVVSAAVVIGLGYLVYRIINRNQSAAPDGVFPKQTSETTPPPLPAPTKRRYVTRKSVLTNAEIVFHKVLLEAVPEAPIFPKVRVADVMEAAERYSGDFLRISQKHFDWVLCNPVSFEPLIAIELDDSSHQWFHKQRKNDQVKDDAAQEAGIVLLRIPWQRDYDVAQIRERIAVVLDQIADAKDAQTTNATRSKPPMVVHPVCRPAQTAAVAVSVQTAMDEMLQKRRAERSGRA